MKKQISAILFMLFVLSCSQGDENGLRLGMNYQTSLDAQAGDVIKTVEDKYSIYKSEYRDIPATLTLSFEDSELDKYVYEFDGSYDSGYMTDRLRDYEELHTFLMSEYGEAKLDQQDETEVYRSHKAIWEIAEGKYAILELTEYSSGIIFFALTYERE